MSGYAVGKDSSLLLWDWVQSSTHAPSTLRGTGMLPSGALTTLVFMWPAMNQTPWAFKSQCGSTLMSHLVRLGHGQ